MSVGALDRGQVTRSSANAISGLTITGGDSNGDNSDDSGGAIALYDTTGALTITNLVITGNHSGNDGGGKCPGLSAPTLTT